MTIQRTAGAPRESVAAPPGVAPDRAVTGAPTSRPMCSAIPAAVSHGWRTDVGCASHALDAIRHADVVHPLCGMHLVMWDHARERGTRVDLATKWGWNV